MTVKKLTGATSTIYKNWNAIQWQKVEVLVKRLQMRIAKAIQEKRFGKVKALQWVLSHSYYAKLLAVRRVTQNSGSKTPGVDNVIWKTSEDKIKAVKTINRKGYCAEPLRRIYIPKKNGKRRPLGIPTLEDRAQQALHLLTLAPISETLADHNSYGFRPYRSCADAIEQCFCVLAKRKSATWILEGDIKSCFDKINHDWLIQNTPMDKRVLKQWLKTGFIYKNEWYETEEGTPQGGIISPTLANMTLDGLETILKSISVKSDKVHLVRYADDFIVTANSKELLIEKIKPAIEAFLHSRGLTLSAEKTHITHIDEGFSFLGFDIRKFNGKLIIKPAKESVKAFLSNIQDTIKKHVGKTTLELLLQINPKICGWVNYYKHVISQKTFEKIDHLIFWMLWRWAEKRHPNKGRRWIQNKYFCRRGMRKWIFYTDYRLVKGDIKRMELFYASYFPIKRHIKIRGAANPFDSKYLDYFENRLRKNKIIFSKAEKISGYALQNSRVITGLIKA
jgi:RNA-directed DNA polymerase